MVNPYLDLFSALEGQSDSLRLSLRKKLIWAFSWAVPDEAAIELLAENAPLLELGAGTGYWAWLARQRGADVLALDQEPLQPPRWTQVEQGTASSCARQEQRTLFLCWPPLDEPMASQALALYRGKRVIYVGEWQGRTADPAFHSELEAGYRQLKTHEIPRWPGFEDRLYLFERK